MTTRKLSRAFQFAFTCIGLGLVLVLALANAASAQTEQVLHSFTGQADGKNPYAGLILDQAGNLYGTTYSGGNTKFCIGFGCGTAFQLSPTAGGHWQEKVLFGFADGSGGGYVYGGLTQDAAGNLYGTTYVGGSIYQCGLSGCGVVFQLSPTAAGPWKETVLHRFSGGSDGRLPLWGSLVVDAGGNVYGTTAYGGNLTACGSGCGVVFELSPTSSGTWTETVIHTFAGSDGADPETQLILDQAGNLYGTARAGGVNNQGVVFELSPTSSGVWQETALYAFTGAPDGAGPGSGQKIVFDAAGNLYGTTTDGGANGYGTVFELSPTSSGTWTEGVLYSFVGGRGSKDGVNPRGGVVFDGGNLYGTTSNGGLPGIPGVPKTPPGCGVVYKLSPSSSGGWTESIVHHFTCLGDGGFPYAGLVVDAAGNLYGTTLSGGIYGYGVVYEITP